MYMLLYTYSVPQINNASIFTGWYLSRSHGIKTNVCVHTPYNMKRSTNWIVVIPIRRKRRRRNWIGMLACICTLVIN